MKLPYRMLLSASLAWAAWLPLAAGAQASPHDEVLQTASSGKPAEALAQADRFLAGQPGDARMRFIRGVILSDMGRTAEAITLFTQLTREFPSMPEPYNNLAVAYAAQGQYEKARAALEGAIRTNAAYATAYENLGDVYARLASQAYSQALQLGGANAGTAPKLALIRSVVEPQNRGTAVAMANPAAAPARNPAPAPAPVSASTSAPAVRAAPPQPPAAVAHIESAGAPAVAGAPAAEVEAAVMQWARAWAERDVPAYLAAYASDFATPPGSSRQRWEETRRLRITEKSSIRVDISNLTVSVAGDNATARFRQAYVADHVRANSSKTLGLRRVDGRWLIVRETTGG